MKAVAASLTLVSDDDTLVLRPPKATAGDPIVCTSWDLGSPAVRESVTDQPSADGVIDRTSFTGARSVTFDLVVFGDRDQSPYAYLDRLTAMTHPRVRPRLLVVRNSPEARGQTWEMELRGNPYSISFGRAAAAKLDLQLSFSAPLGYLEGDWQGFQSLQADDSSAVGFSAPFFFPLATGNTNPANPILTLNIGGKVPINPVVYIYGPATNPEVTDDTGQRFKFAGLTLTSAQFVQIDMGHATVRLMGSPDASVYHLVDWSVSTFWQWRPGQRIVRYLATRGSVAVQWRDRRYSI